MNSKEANKAIASIEQMEQSLAQKGRLHLTVLISTPEQARQLLMWMHAPAERKPMLSKLIDIAWDQELVSKEAAEAVRTIQKSIQL